jgi:hypothetical protein
MPGQVAPRAATLFEIEPSIAPMETSNGQINWLRCLPVLLENGEQQREVPAAEVLQQWHRQFPDGIVRRSNPLVATQFPVDYST